MTVLLFAGQSFEEAVYSARKAGATGALWGAVLGAGIPLVAAGIRGAAQGIRAGAARARSWFGRTARAFASRFRPGAMAGQYPFAEAHAPVTGSQWFEAFQARYGAGNVQWSRLPEFTGPRSAGGSGTIGVLRTASGDFDVISGRAGPASSMSGDGFDIVSRMHAEGHTAAIMRRLGASEGILFINNPDICSSCMVNLNRMIPPGARLTVVLPNGTRIPFPRSIP